MSPKIDFKEVAPGADDARRPMLQYVEDCTIPKELVELVYLRVSQINGCAYCVDLHTRRLREYGEGERKIATVIAWRDAPFFTEREEIALEWAEAVTNLGIDHIPNELDERISAEFSEREIVDLTFVIGLMNMLNRISVSLHRQPPTDA